MYPVSRYRVSIKSLLCIVSITYCVHQAFLTRGLVEAAIGTPEWRDTRPSWSSRRLHDTSHVSSENLLAAEQVGTFLGTTTQGTLISSSADASQRSPVPQPIQPLSAATSINSDQRASMTTHLDNAHMGRQRRRLGSVGRLPKSYGPDSPSWTNSIAVCVTCRDENVTDMREWLQYYRWIGVDHVFLTENMSKHPIQEGIKEFIDSGFVTYQIDNRMDAHLSIYQRCFMRYRTAFNWMAFFDADEYLAVREKNKTLKQILNDYKYEAGLSVFWVRVGSNNRTTRPEEGGVLRAYTKCEGEPTNLTKLIANMFFMYGTSTTHTVRFWDKMTPVAEDMRHFALNERNGVPDVFMGRPTANRLALFHYAIKSREDFATKLARGGGDGKFKKGNFFERIDNKSIDAPLCRELAQIADACCPHGKSSLAFTNSTQHA